MNNVIQDDKVSDTKDVRYKEGHAMGRSVWACKGPSYGLASTFTAWGNGHCSLTGNANSADEGTVNICSCCFDSSPREMLPKN